jgi:hypothetical protein
MKKRTAIILFGALLCSTAGYAAWCFRSFYLSPPLEFVGDVSPGAREAMEDWRWSANRPRPLRFEWSTAWGNLCHPWDCRMSAPVEVVEVVEVPEEGLWARTSDDLWGFSKIGNEWDASAAFHHGSFPIFSYSPRSRLIDRQGWIASRIDAWGSSGATIEILSLGPQTTFGRLLRQTGQGPGLGPNTPDVFYDHEVLGRVKVSETRDRQDLLDGFTRSIREADVDTELPRWCVFPRHGIILTWGELRAEYLVSFEDGDAYCFEDAIGDIDGFHEAYEFRRGKMIDPNESSSYFRLSPRYQSVFDAILDKDGIERAEQEKK